MNITKKEIKALAIADANYAIASCDAAASKEEFKKAVSNLERIYSSEVKSYNIHQSMDPAAYSGVYVFNNTQAAVYRSTRAEAYKKAICRIKDVLQNMN